MGRPPALGASKTRPLSPVVQSLPEGERWRGVGGIPRADSTPWTEGRGAAIAVANTHTDPGVTYLGVTARRARPPGLKAGSGTGRGARAARGTGTGTGAAHPAHGAGGGSGGQKGGEASAADPDGGGEGGRRRRQQGPQRQGPWDGFPLAGDRPSGQCEGINPWPPSVGRAVVRGRDRCSGGDRRGPGGRPVRPELQRELPTRPPDSDAGLWGRRGFGNTHTHLPKKIRGQHGTGRANT